MPVKAEATQRSLASVSGSAGKYIIKNFDAYTRHARAVRAALSSNPLRAREREADVLGVT